MLRPVKESRHKTTSKSTQTVFSQSITSLETTYMGLIVIYSFEIYESNISLDRNESLLQKDVTTDSVNCVSKQTFAVNHVQINLKQMLTFS